MNNLLTKLARAVLGNIGPRSWQYGLSEVRSVLPRLRANIPQYGPRTRLVSGCYYFEQVGLQIDKKFNEVEKQKKKKQARTLELHKRTVQTL